MIRLVLIGACLLVVLLPTSALTGGGPIQQAEEYGKMMDDPNGPNQKHLKAQSTAYSKVTTLPFSVTDIADIRLVGGKTTSSLHVTFKKPYQQIESLEWSVGDVEAALAFIRIIQENRIQSVLVQTHVVIFDKDEVVACKQCPVREWIFRLDGKK